MYKAPTLPSAAFNATSAQTQPKRQSMVLCEYYILNSKVASIGNFEKNSEGGPAHLNYISVNGVAKQNPRASGLIALSSDASGFTDLSAIPLRWDRFFARHGVDPAASAVDQLHSFLHSPRAAELGGSVAHEAVGHATAVAEWQLVF